MPVYLSSNGYGYTYKVPKRKGGHKKKLKILIVIAIVIVAIFFCFQFYNFIKSKNNVNSTKNFYALSIAKYENQQLAQNMATNIKLQSGAGYVYFYNNEYYVLVSCYKNKDDAIKVRDNLNDNGYQLEIVNLEIKSVNFDLKLTNEQKKCLENSLNLFIDNYSYLYDKSIEIDCNTTTVSELKEDLNKLYINNQEIINNLNNTVKDVSYSKVIYLKIYLNTLQEKLKQLIEIQSNYSSFIKETYFEILFLRCKI